MSTSYNPHEWADGPEGGTPITAERLNALEQGVAEASAEVNWGNLPGKPATFPPTVGTTATTAKAGNWNPTIGNVTGLQAALDGKQASGSYAAASHTHTVAQVTGLQAALDAIEGRLDALEEPEA